MRFPDVLTITNPGAPVQDPGTGNARPGPTIEQQVRGVIHERALDAASQHEVAQSGTVIQLVAMVETTDLVGAPTVLVSEDATITDSDGLLYEVVGVPRPRRPMTPPRRVEYIAAAVRLSTDTQETP